MKKHKATQEHEDFTKLKQLQQILKTLSATHEAHNVVIESENSGDEINVSFTLKRIKNTDSLKIRGALRYRFVKPTYRAKPSELFYPRGEDCGVVFFRREVADMYHGLTDKARNDISNVIASLLELAQAADLRKGTFVVSEAN